MRALPAAFALAAACAAARPAAPPRPPALGDRGEFLLYVQPFPQQAARLSFTIASVAVVGTDGRETPLEVVRAVHAGGPDGRDQELAAAGRVDAGTFTRLRIGLSAASLRTRDGKADLVVPEEPVDLGGGPFALEPGGALVLHLALRAGAADGAVALGASAFDVVVPDQPVPDVLGYCSGGGALLSLDTRRKQVIGAAPTGTPSHGVVIDPVARRAYVALPDQDTIAVVDVAAREPLRRFRLAAGDQPVDVALGRDRRALLVVNAGANSVAFVEPSSGLVLSRLPTGEDPGALLVDRDGRRAFVLNRLSRTVTVVDVANRATAATLPVDGQPLRADVSRAGDRLYVIAEGSPFLFVFGTRDLALENRIHVGLGATFVRVDPATDLVYVADGQGGSISIYDPFSLVPMDLIEVPGPATWLEIDAAEKALYALVPSLGSVFVVDLVTRRIVATLDVGNDARELVLPVPRS